MLDVGENARVVFTVPGKPHGKQRPRFVRQTGRTYTPDETVRFEEVVRDLGLLRFKAPLVGPVRLTIVASFQTPKSWSKRKHHAMLGRPHTQRPDLANLVKSIEDGLNRVAYADDSQVAEYGPCRKVWAERDETTVIVESI